MRFFYQVVVVLIFIGGSVCFAQTVHLPFESEKEILSDFVSEFERYKTKGEESLVERKLGIAPGRFGNALNIVDGYPFSQGTWNESGLDCDLIVATMWGEWHKKPHFWGTGAFHGDRGTIAFWVKKEDLDSGGIVFMQGAIAWGRKERDLFTIEVDDEGRLSAHIRDVRYRYHKVTAKEPTWRTGEWQHIATVWDRAFGLRLYHNGRVVATNWGDDAWWGTPLPGLFSPFLPESSYDEIYFFDRPLTESEVARLFELNQPPDPSGEDFGGNLDQAAKTRLANAFADFETLDLAILEAGSEGIKLTQVAPIECSDGHIPAGWVMDGRYELAWPHPYRMFTFILGDVDFHGTTVDMKFREDLKPNHVFIEGNLSGLSAQTGNSGDPTSGREILRINDYETFLYAQGIDLGNDSNLRFPLTKDFGSPPDLEGSANLPLSGDLRIHEIHLWRTEKRSPSAEDGGSPDKWFLGSGSLQSLGERYGGALSKLAGSRDRTTVQSQSTLPSINEIRWEPFTSIHLFGPDLVSDSAIDGLGLRLFFKPNSKSDVFWFRIRDPANPSRLWAQALARIHFDAPGDFQTVHVEFDVIDLMVGPGDRLWMELVSKEGGQLRFGDAENPSTIYLRNSEDAEESLAEYVDHELLPARMQYSKEYNYKPWSLTGEKVSLDRWSQFGGPYDMAYPVLATLRRDPEHPVANHYETLVFHRGSRGWVPPGQAPPPTTPLDGTAPPWAFRQRELFQLNQRVGHWIASVQRPDGQFWGGWNDDSFIPLGFPSLPLLGDQKTRKAWLDFYDGLEEAGIFADGYCDIWPIDPLHITDYIASRGLMLAFALGDPKVFERELRTTERYNEKVDQTNRRLEREGRPPLDGERTGREREDVTLIEQMESEILRYSSTHLNWYWGKTYDREPHRIENEDTVAQSLMNAVSACDESTVFAITEAMIHTDGHGGGIGRNELISTSLGGRLQGRVEAYPHSIAVSWSDGDPNLARLVRYADGKSLEISLYNFSEGAVDTQLRVWRLEPGRYEILQESGGRTIFKNERDLRRFSIIPLSIPKGGPTLVRIRRQAALSEPSDLPDLAVGALEIQSSGNRVVVTVHNIGAAPAENVRIDLEDERGRALESRLVPLIGSPVKDFKPKRARVVFENIGSAKGLVVRVDPAGEILEILKENNTASAPTD